MSSSEQDERALFNYWPVLMKWRWLIIGIIFISILLAFWVSIRLPEIFKSEAKILYSQGVSRAQANAQFVTLLTSQLMMDDVIKTFNLMDHYKANTIEDARKELKTNTIIESATSATDPFLGRITIGVEDTDPQMAANITNYYVDNLKLLNQRLESVQKEEQSVFIGKRLTEVRSKIAQTEEALITLVSSLKIRKMAQDQPAINKLRDQLLLLESGNEEGGMPQRLPPSLPMDIVGLTRLRLALELQQWFLTREERFLTREERLLNSFGANTSFFTLLRMFENRSEALQFRRLSRELQDLEFLSQTLHMDFERAEAAEATYQLTFQVLDKAVPSKEKSRPKIGVNMIMAGIVGFLVANFLVFLLEYLKRPPSSLKPQSSSS